MKTHFVVAGTPRCGTSFLCDLLHKNGLGNANEDFNALTYTSGLGRAIAFGQSTEEYARSLISSQLEEVFGTKLHWFFVEKMLIASKGTYKNIYEFLNAIFPQAKYIYITRDDKLGQAISLARALDSGEFSRMANGPEEPRAKMLDIPHEKLHGILLANLESEYNWRRMFASANVVPLHVTYEALCNDTKGVVESVGQFILGGKFEVRTLVSEMTIQRDEDSERARERFLTAVEAPGG